MKHLYTLSQSAAAGLVLMAAAQAWAQAPTFAGTPADAKRGAISQPVQPSVKPQLQTTTVPKITKTWDHQRYPRKTVTGTVTPVAPVPAPQTTPQPGHGKCPPGLAKKNNGCLPPGHAK